MGAAQTARLRVRGPARERPRVPSGARRRLPDDFAREARERKMLVSGTRGPVFIECKVSAQTVGRAISYPCEVVSLVAVAGDRISDLLRRSRDQKLEYYHY